MLVAHSNTPDAVRCVRQVRTRTIAGISLTTVAVLLIVAIQQLPDGLLEAVLSIAAALALIGALAMYVLLESPRDELKKLVILCAVLKVSYGVRREYAQITREANINASRDGLFKYAYDRTEALKVARAQLLKRHGR